MMMRKAKFYVSNPLFIVINNSNRFLFVPFPSIVTDARQFRGCWVCISLKQTKTLEKPSDHKSIPQYHCTTLNVATNYNYFFSLFLLCSLPFNFFLKKNYQSSTLPLKNTLNALYWIFSHKEEERKQTGWIKKNCLGW